MSPIREYSHARWHSRAGFIMTTLLVLLVMGAPFMVTRGILTHGALFLPAVAGLVLLLGGPLIRLALATGRLDHREAGRESLQTVQALIRVVIAVVLLVVGVRAAGWLFQEALYGVPAGALAYQSRELTTYSTAWHGVVTPSVWWGMGSVGLLTLILLLFARRRRLAGLSWLAGWLLALIMALMLLALLVGYSMPGAGALAAMAAPVRLNALWSMGFWGDASAAAMLALGAQTGVITAGGRGMPKRAGVGREARILVAGMTFLMVLAGLSGLLLLSAVCYRQGIVPEPAHAAPGVLLLDVVPMLGPELFQGWADNWRPSSRQITLGWCFLVALSCAFGAGAMLGARRLLPRDWNSSAARFGYLGAGVCVATLAASLLIGTEDAYLPLLTVMPALLAVIRITMARRAGAGMRVVSVAFESSRPWLERLYLTLAFRVVRPLLLATVVAVALTRREYSIMLAGFAVAFALMWMGSLYRRPRSLDTGLIRAAALTLLLLAPVAIAAQSGHSDPVRAAFERILAAPDHQARHAARDDFETVVMRAQALGLDADGATYRKDINALIHTEGAPDYDTARDAAIASFLIEPAHEDSLRLEREILEHDGVAPFPRLDEAFSDYAASERRPLLVQLRLIDANIQGPRLKNMLDAPPSAPELMIALTTDLRHGYGSAGPRARELRRYLVQRATNGRTLLTPDPGPGVIYLLCFLLSAGTVALALTFGIGRPRR
ncbi:MAG: hypothetical protein K8I27_15500 [Planctomycetes bacterium]|nr:hypothetical protein [Planctomycetota bacterium]